MFPDLINSGLSVRCAKRQKKKKKKKKKTNTHTKKKTPTNNYGILASFLSEGTMGITVPRRELPREMT